MILAVQLSIQQGVRQFRRFAASRCCLWLSDQKAGRNPTLFVWAAGWGAAAQRSCSGCAAQLQAGAGVPARPARFNASVSALLRGAELEEGAAGLEGDAGEPGHAWRSPARASVNALRGDG